MSQYNNYLAQARTPIGKWLKEKRASVEWRMIKAAKESISRILEIGPGYGDFAQILPAHDYYYLALESNWLIGLGMHQKKHAVCQVAVPPFPIKSETFDVVYASHVIEHMPGPLAAYEFIKEANRVLVDNGILALSAPDMLAFGNLFWEADYTHTFPVTARRLIQLLEDLDFTEHTVRYFSGPIFGLFSNPVNFFARYLFFHIGWLPRVTQIRLERIRFTFLRNVFILARKSQPYCKMREKKP